MSVASDKLPMLQWMGCPTPMSKRPALSVLFQKKKKWQRGKKEIKMGGGCVETVFRMNSETDVASLSLRPDTPVLA